MYVLYFSILICLCMYVCMCEQSVVIEGYKKMITSYENEVCMLKEKIKRLTTSSSTSTPSTRHSSRKGRKSLSPLSPSRMNSGGFTQTVITRKTNKYTEEEYHHHIHQQRSTSKQHYNIDMNNDSGSNIENYSNSKSKCSLSVVSGVGVIDDGGNGNIYGSELGI